MVSIMKLTIIETGRPPDPISADFPAYPVMLERLIRPFLPEVTVEVVSVLDGTPLPHADTIEAMLITGSPVGVYDPVAWIAPLKRLINEVAEVKAPQVGICFGHQLMAEAFGGVAAKAPQGWGLGCHRYELSSTLEPWMEERVEGLHLAVSHQDQVLERPPTARVLAHSSFTPHAALVYDHAPALSFQGHPEFCSVFTHALISSRRGTRFCEELADTAIASLARPLDGQVVARWIASFYRHARQTLAETGPRAARFAA
jgi:GMP synthase-like glutamine amidotransferase